MDEFCQLAECLGDIYGDDEMCMIVGAMTNEDVLSFFE